MGTARAARLLFQLPRQCRVYCAINPALQWGWQELLANKANFLLDVLVWRGGRNAKHLSKAPRLFVPPFMKKEEPISAINRDSEKHTVADIKAILARPRK